MKFLCKMKDGGCESPVDGYFLIEIKSLFSIVLLKFNKGGREAYHSHAFNSLTWFICGDMEEERLYKEPCYGRIYCDDDHKFYSMFNKYKHSLFPKITKRNNLHRVRAFKNSWCLSIRGKWVDTWQEYVNGKFVTLTHGRKVIQEEKTL